MVRINHYWKNLQYLATNDLLRSGLITLAWLVLSFRHIQSALQTNALGPLADFLIICISTVAIMILVLISWRSGQLIGSVGERVCIAALRVMVVMGASAAYLTLLLKQFFTLIYYLLDHLSRSLHWDGQPDFPAHTNPLVKLASPSKLPYRLYPVSCILLN